MQKLTNWIMVLVVMLAGAGHVAHAAISYSYFYDDLDRLTKATDSTGVAIDYVYDEVGNHLAVNRTILAPFTILNITPSAGAVGARVVVDGRGFSAVPGDNQVAFNGVNATVVSATATQLEVDVPAGATTGPIRITVGVDSISSSRGFQVQVLPVIRGLSTQFVLSGAPIPSLVVSGKNLTGATFVFTPAFVPVAVTVDRATVAADGASADLAVGINAEAVGTFVLQATNTAGQSDAVGSTDNTLTVLGAAGDDLDGDGLTNGEEIALGTNPTLSDSDGDGLPDKFEVDNGFDPNNAADAFVDSDNDGLSNLVEFQQGTDPLNPDTTPPAVAQIDPVDGFVDFPTNGRMVVRFNEPLRPDSVIVGAVRLFQDALAVAGEIPLSNDQLSVTFKPSESLSAFTTYTLEVQGVRDVAGNPIVGITRSQFTTGAFIDDVPPTVLSTSIAIGQGGVPVNAPYTVRFDEPMDPATLDSASFSLRDNTTFQNLAGMIQVDADGLTVSFVPEQPLPIGRTFSVQLNASRITDLAGNLLSGSRFFSFSSSFVADTAPPILLGVSPTDGFANVPTNARVELRFSEPLNRIDIQNVVSLQAAGSNVPGSIALSDGNRLLTFTPTTVLAPGLLHTLTVTAQLADLAGNAFAGPVSTSFTTGTATDAVRPTLVSVSIPNSAVGVPTDVSVQVRFSEVMNRLTLTPSTLFIDNASTGAPVAGTVAVSADGLSATFTPVAPLGALTRYRVRAFSGMQDLAGNTYVGTSVPASFTTGIGSDSTAPVVAQTSLSGAVQVPVNAQLVVQLSEPVDIFSIGPNSVQVSVGGVPVTGTVTLSADRRSLTFVPDSPLATSTRYDILITGLTDLGGNVLTPFTDSFGTSLLSVADTVRPTIAGMSPASGSTGVAVGAPIAVVFSEAVDPTSVDISSLPVTVDGFSGSVAAVYVVVANQVSITPLSPLPGGARVRVTANGSVRDLAGNPNSFFRGFFDTATTPDTTPPALLSVTPTDGRVDVGLNSAVVLTFSESLDAATINGTNFTLFANGKQLVPSVGRSPDNRTVTLNATLPADSLIQVAVTAAVQDLSGNAMADFISQFRTGPAFDSGRPTVTTQRPGNGASTIPLNSTVVLFANESLDAASVPGALHVSQDGAVVTGSVRVTADGRAVEFTPSAPWSPGSLIQVFLDSTAVDVSGNALRAYQGSFRTVPDLRTTTATVVRDSLAGVPKGEVPRNTVVEIEYSKPLDPATVNAGTVVTSLVGNAAPPDFEQTFDATLVSGGVRTFTIPGLQVGATFRAFTDNTVGTGTPDIMLGVFDENGTLLTVNDDGSALGSGSAAAANGVVNLDGTIRLKVTGFPDSSFTGTHTVSGDYRLYVIVGVADPNVGATLSLVQGGRVIRIEPQAVLAAGARHSVQINGVQDLDGQPVTAFSRTFPTGVVIDSVAPTVAGVSPPDGVADVPLNTQIRVRFDEPINPLTVDETSVLLSDGISQTVACSIAFIDGNREVLLVPHALLAANQPYRLTISGVEDRAGNAVVTQTTTFTSTAALDTVRPRVISRTPFSNATEVPVNSPVILTVDKRVDPLTVTPATLVVRDNTTFQNIPGSYSVSADGREISFVPDAPFTVGRIHGVSVSGSSVRDLAGNTITGANFSFTTAFTGDVTAPTMLGVSPVDNSAGVPLNAQVQVRFDEPVQGTGLAGVSLSANGNPVPVTVVLSDANRLLTLTPQALLDATTLHTVTLNGIRDLAGNALADTTSSFTTGTSFDLIRPTLVSVSIPNNAVDVPIDVSVQVSFSEVMNGLTLTPTTIFIDNATTGAPMAGTVVVSADGLSATFTPSAPLSALARYRVRTFNMQDLAGNTYASTSVPASFTTGTGSDSTAPVVTQTSLSGAAQVPVNAQLVVQLSEPVDIFSVGPNSVQVRVGGVLVAGTVTLSADRRSLTFVPDSPLATNTTYDIVVSGLTDLGGNVLTPFTDSFGTGLLSVADSVRPTIAGMSPASGSTGVAVGAPIVVVFSEAVDPTSVDINSLPVTVDGFSGSVAADYAVVANQVSITPLSPLPGGARIRVRVNSTRSVRDLAGNVSGSFSGFFDTAATQDTLPPTVLSVTPTDGRVDIGLNSAVVLTFSESLDAATINGTNFTLFANGKQLVPSVGRSPDNRTVTLNATLPADSLIQVAVTAAVQDLSGNRLTDFVSQFRTGPAFDSGQPSVTTQRPGNGASNIPLNSTVVLFINESLDASSASGALHISQDGAVVSGSVRVTADGRAVEFTPSAPWSPGNLIQVFLDSTAVDVSGNALRRYQGSFRTVPDPALQRPLVVSDTLASISTGALLNPVLEVKFSEALDATTVDGTTVLLHENIGGRPVVAATVSLRGDRVIRVVPNAALTANTSYFLDVLNGVQDLQGQTPSTSTSLVTVIFRSVFTTGNQSDAVSPAVAGVSPPDGAADVPLNTQIRVRFDEPINPLTVDETSVLLSDGASQTVACSIAFSDGDREVLLVPHALLAANQPYRLTISGVEDRAGNAVVTQTTTFTSTAALDTVRPRVISTTPFSGAVDVPVNSPVVLSVDERVDPLTVTSTTLLVRDNTIFQNLPGTYSVSADGREISFAPDVPFAVGRSHSVFVSGSSIQDLTGNTITGANISFTTAFTGDTTAPALVGISPTNSSNAVPLNVRIQVRFDEPVQGTSLAGAGLSANGAAVPVTVVLSDANRLLTLTPQALLDATTLHTVTLNGIQDLAGNALADTTSGFTTGTSFDLVRPTLASVSVPNSAVGVPTDVSVQVRFSEVMNGLTLTPSTVFIDNATTGVPVAGTVVVSADGMSATFTPSAPLAALTRYRVRTLNMRDLAGNAYASTSVPANFTTVP